LFAQEKTLIYKTIKTSIAAAFSSEKTTFKCR